MSSGSWAGEAAGRFALSLGQRAAGRNVKSTSQTPLGSNLVFSKKSEPAISETIERVQNEVMPYEINLFRTESKLDASLQRLNQLWTEIRNDKFKKVALMP